VVVEQAEELVLTEHLDLQQLVLMVPKILGVAVEVNMPAVSQHREVPVLLYLDS
jgi:hypothetical protein